LAPLVDGRVSASDYHNIVTQRNINIFYLQYASELILAEVFETDMDSQSLFCHNFNSEFFYHLDFIQGYRTSSYLRDEADVQKYVMTLDGTVICSGKTGRTCSDYGNFFACRRLLFRSPWLRPCHVPVGGKTFDIVYCHGRVYKVGKWRRYDWMSIFAGHVITQGATQSALWSERSCSRRIFL